MAPVTGHTRPSPVRENGSVLRGTASSASAAGVEIVKGGLTLASGNAPVTPGLHIATELMSVVKER